MQRLLPFLLLVWLASCTTAPPATLTVGLIPSTPSPPPATLPSTAPASLPPSAVPPTLQPPDATRPPAPLASLPLPTATPPPAATPPTPTTTPAPPALLRPTAPPTPTRPSVLKLTADGCCPYPQWLADSSGIVYYGPGGANDAQLGTWAIARTGGPARLLSAQFGLLAADQSLLITRTGGVARITDRTGKTLGDLTTGPALLALAPTNDRLAWLVPDPTIPQVSTSLEPPARIRVAQLGPDGLGEIRTFPPIVRAETIQWFPDGRQIVLSARDESGRQGGVVVIDTVTGSSRKLVDGLFLESVAVAPDGSAVVYTAVLQQNPADNGIWLVQADGRNRRRLDISGGYRWQPDSRGLVYLPAPAPTSTDELWAINLTDNSKRPLVRASQLQFRIAASDWELAPDGSGIVYRANTDGAIWILSFGR